MQYAWFVDSRFYKKVSTLSFRGIFFAVLLIVALRVLAEWIFLEYPLELTVFQSHLRFYLENTFYFLILFLFSSVFLSKVIPKPLIDVMRFGVLIYPVIIIPPIIDVLLFGEPAGYNYGATENILTNILTFTFVTEDASNGIGIEIILGLIGAAGFVFYHTKSILKSLAAFVVINVFMILLSTPDLIYGLEGGDYYNDYFLPTYYFFPLIFYVCAVLALYRCDKLFAFAKNVRWVRSGVFILAGFFGWLLGGGTYTSESNTISLMCALSSVFFMWQVSLLINDTEDIAIDRISNPKRPLPSGTLDAVDFQVAIPLMAFVSLSLASVIHGMALVLMLIFLGLSYIYSTPPFRFRKTFAGNIIIGLSLVISCTIGFLAKTGRYLAFDTKESFFLGYIFLCGVLIPLCKDIKDIEGDRAENIKNLFTVFGKSKAKRIVAILITCVFALPLLAQFNPGILLCCVLAPVAVSFTEEPNIIYALAIINICIAYQMLF